MRARLQHAGVATRMHYPTPVHLQPAYAHLGRGEGSSRSPRRSRARPCRCRSIPSCRDADVARVIDAVNTIVADSREAGLSRSNKVQKSDLSGRRILVTGGAGFVGSHIVDQLVALGAGKIVVVDNMVRGRVGNLAERAAAAARSSSSTATSATRR